MLARIPFGLTTGPIEGAEILVAGCRKETVASEMRSNVLKYRDTLLNSHLARCAEKFSNGTGDEGTLLRPRGFEGSDLGESD
jgi:hypothetical protein